MTSKHERAAFLKLARARFKQAEEANKNQRQRELDDLRFYAGDQWPKEIRDSRAGLDTPAAGMPAVPPRPCLTINKTRKPVREVLNQEQSADMGLEIVEADDFGGLTDPIDDTEIELREGLTRRVQRDSKASDARSWAFARAKIAGVGAYIVRTRYAKGKTRDQEIYVDRIFNQSCVSFDPAHEEPDGSDCEWEFIWTDMPWNLYKATYGKRNGRNNLVLSCNADEWRTLGDEAKDWFGGDFTNTEMRTVRVGEYFYAEYEPREVVTYRSPNGEQEISEWLSEMPDAPEGWEEIDRHADLRKTIKWCTLDGCDDDVLDETTWPGPDMPIIKVVDEELHPYDNERRVEGMVRSMREPGQGFNVMVSSWVERIGYAPLPPLMMVEGQAEGYEDWYKAANTRALPYLYYKNSDLNGQRVDQPPFAPDRGLGQVIGPLAQSVQLFDQALQDVSVSNPAMGQTDPSVKSARHANLLREQAQQSTSHGLTNLKRSMQYEAQIINNLLYPIYGSRPGRLARIIDGQGEKQRLIIGRPMVTQNGRPMPAQADTPDAKHYKLTPDSHFNYAIKISKNSDTRRQQENEMVGEVIAAAPQLMSVVGDLFFKSMDGPGHTEMADRMRVMLDPKVDALLQSKEQGQGPPDPHTQQLMAENAQLKQVAQQLQQAVQTDQVKAQATMQVAQVKAQADVQMAQQDAQLKIQIAQMDNAAKIEVARIGAAKALLDTQAAAQEERLSTGLELQHEARENALDRSHQAGMGAMTGVQGAQGDEADRAHQQQMAASGQAATSAEADAGRQHDAEMQAQQQQAAQAQTQET